MLQVDVVGFAFVERLREQQQQEGVAGSQQLPEEDWGWGSSSESSDDEQQEDTDAHASAGGAGFEGDGGMGVSRGDTCLSHHTYDNV